MLINLITQHMHTSDGRVVHSVYKLLSTIITKLEEEKGNQGKRKLSLSPKVLLLHSINKWLHSQVSYFYAEC